MKVFSRNVKITDGENVFLDVESYLLDSLNLFSSLIHPRKETDIVLTNGAYTLNLEAFRLLEVED